MRCGLILAALTALSATTAHAENWCGYAARENAVIECGYSTAADCETAIGKGGMCFIDPEYALNSKRAMPVSRHSEVPGKRPSNGDGLGASASSFEARFARTSG